MFVRVMNPNLPQVHTMLRQALGYVRLSSCPSSVAQDRVDTGLPTAYQQLALPHHPLLLLLVRLVRSCSTILHVSGLPNLLQVAFLSPSLVQLLAELLCLVWRAWLA
jgi:hypothetical protein